MQVAVAMEKETDRVRFARIAQEHHRMLLIYARTLLRDEGEARELVQDTLVTAWKNLTRFDVTRDIGSWLRGIVRNKWREHCRREGKRAEFAVGDPGSVEADLAAWERLKDKPLFEALQVRLAERAKPDSVPADPEGLAEGVPAEFGAVEAPPAP